MIGYGDATKPYFIIAWQTCRSGTLVVSVCPWKTMGSLTGDDELCPAPTFGTAPLVRGAVGSSTPGAKSPEPEPSKMSISTLRQPARSARM